MINHISCKILISLSTLSQLSKNKRLKAFMNVNERLVLTLMPSITAKTYLTIEERKRNDGRGKESRGATAV
jgi:hypothetical protein